MLPILTPVTPPPSKDVLSMLSPKQIEAALDCKNMPYAAVVSEFVNLESPLVFFDHRLFVNADHCRWYWLLKYYTKLKVDYRFDENKVGYITSPKCSSLGRTCILVVCRLDQKEAITDLYKADKDRSYDIGFVWGTPSVAGGYEFWSKTMKSPFTIPLWGIEMFAVRGERPPQRYYHTNLDIKGAMRDGVGSLRKTLFTLADSL